MERFEEYIEPILFCLYLGCFTLSALGASLLFLFNIGG